MDINTSLVVNETKVYQCPNIECRQFFVPASRCPYCGQKVETAEQSKALMVIVPEDVNTNYETRISGARTMHLSSVKAYNGDAYETGRKLGYNAMKRNTLCG